MATNPDLPTPRQKDHDAEIRVEVINDQARLPVDPGVLAELARVALRGEGVQRADITIVLTDNSTIQQINARRLGHDWPTDVITFPLSDPGAAELSGELVLSAEMAAGTASDACVDPRDELVLYMVHGLLHLCGYDDETDEDTRAMRHREAVVLSRVGVPNTFGIVGPDGSTAVGEDAP